jgi:hypothetical protein
MTSEERIQAILSRREASVIPEDILTLIAKYREELLLELVELQKKPGKKSNALQLKKQKLETLDHWLAHSHSPNDLNNCLDSTLRHDKEVLDGVFSQRIAKLYQALRDFCTSKLPSSAAPAAVKSRWFSKKGQTYAPMSTAATDFDWSQEEGIDEVRVKTLRTPLIASGHRAESLTPTSSGHTFFSPLPCTSTFFSEYEETKIRIFIERAKQEREALKRQRISLLSAQAHRLHALEQGLMNEYNDFETEQTRLESDLDESEEFVRERSSRTRETLSRSTEIPLLSVFEMQAARAAQDAASPYSKAADALNAACKLTPAIDAIRAAIDFITMKLNLIDPIHVAERPPPNTIDPMIQNNRALERWIKQIKEPKSNSIPQDALVFEKFKNDKLIGELVEKIDAELTADKANFPVIEQEDTMAAQLPNWKQSCCLARLKEPIATVVATLQRESRELEDTLNTQLNLQNRHLETAIDNLSLLQDKIQSQLKQVAPSFTLAFPKTSDIDLTTTQAALKEAEQAQQPLDATLALIKPRLAQVDQQIEGFNTLLTIDTHTALQAFLRRAEQHEFGNLRQEPKVKSLLEELELNPHVSQTLRPILSPSEVKRVTALLTQYRIELPKSVNETTRRLKQDKINALCALLEIETEANLAGFMQALRMSTTYGNALQGKHFKALLETIETAHAASARQCCLSEEHRDKVLALITLLRAEKEERYANKDLKTAKIAALEKLLTCRTHHALKAYLQSLFENVDSPVLQGTLHKRVKDLLQAISQNSTSLLTGEDETMGFLL